MASLPVTPQIAFEKHFRVAELAQLWGFCENTIIRLFTAEEGVIRLERAIGKRKYTTLSIPESVAVRVHQRLGHKSLQSSLSTGNPLRVIRLRDLDRRMPKQPRHVIKLKTSEKLSNSKRVS